jgi:hypothetical protein
VNFENVLWLVFMASVTASAVYSFVVGDIPKAIFFVLWLIVLKLYSE